MSALRKSPASIDRSRSGSPKPWPAIAFSDNSSAVHLRGDFQFRYGQATDAGLKDRNEDSLGIRVPDDLTTLATKGIAAVIADGVSAAEAAREAADLSVLGFLNDYYSTPESWEVKTSGHRVLTALNRWLFAEGQGFRDEGRGFVCAMSSLVLKGRWAHLFHVGDTRIWRLRDGSLEQLTRDHCQRISRDREYLSRAMGLSLSLKVDYQKAEVREGDVFLLTTDGLHSFVRSRDLAAMLSSGLKSPDNTCERLIRTALDHGSPDNVSCQLILIEKLPVGDPGSVLDELNRLPFPPDLDPGMKIDGWEVEKLLDASPRSQLYVVRHVESGKRAVMKTPSVNYSDDPAYIERFILEEWIGRRIESARVVRVLEKSAPPKFLYYLMEHIRGQPLDVWARERQLDVQRVVSLAAQIVDGLRAMHRKEALHQDLRPANILVGRDDAVTIIDLGSVRIAGIQELEVPFERGRRLGALRYAAPEYVLDLAPSPRSDQFSLAVILYELFTKGQHPYGERFETADSLKDFSRLKYTPAFRHNPLVPIWIDGALRKALDLRPENRYDALSEFIADLKKPNPAFVRSARELPLIERNPLRFWQWLAAALAVIWLITLWFWLSS
jgi:serine/threonine protein phosphatase PrpC